MDEIDERFRLVGDEDTGVGVHCLTCDTGGAPLAHLSGGGPSPYEGTGVIVAGGIGELLTAADVHGWYVHGWRPAFNAYSRARFDLAATERP